MRTLDTRLAFQRPRGFALIGVLLLLLIISALAVSVSYLTMREKKVAGGDRDSNVAFYGAEGGLEKLNSDLTYLYQQKMSPVKADLDALSANMPTLPGITFTEYKVVPTNGSMLPVPATLTTGPNAGLNALMVKLTSFVTAQAPGTGQVRMVRNLEVALIPVFQFGMFSDTDLTFHNGPDMDFYGRIHTNGNLYLVPLSSGTATFHDQLSAVKDVIRQTMPTGGSSAGYQGNVAIPMTANGCSSLQAKTGVSTATCRLLALSEGSLPFSVPLPATWVGLSSTTYHNKVINFATGAKSLQLPFVNGGAKPVEIIRQPPAGESASSAVGLSRYFNEAQIRVLLDDDSTLLPIECQHKEASGKFGIVELDASQTQTTGLAHVQVYAPGTSPTGAASAATPTFAMGNSNADTTNWQWLKPAGKDVSLLDTITWNGGARQYNSTFVCVLGKNAAGTFFPVTNEWLALGFEQGTHPNAILNLQEPATTAHGAYKSWPINMYDAREGEYRPAGGANGTVAINGIMNLVELNVGNLNNWLKGVTGNPGSSQNVISTTVDKVVQNGYILYFSDRRGMVKNPNAQPVTNVKNGESGLEDVINTPISGTGTPNGFLDGVTGNVIVCPDGVTRSLFAEDADQNCVLDRWGETNLGLGFNLAQVNHTTITPQNRVTTVVAQQNVVAGPRHALRLVNGTSGNLPSNGPVGGFSVASEQPVYILKNYNANASDGAVSFENWNSTHVAASVVADAVTLLSNSWDDGNSFTNSTVSGNRIASETWFRTAVAAGKTQTFTDSGSTVNFGGDGGVHNFLRYLETWTNNAGPVTSHYRGSMVSFYFSQYATGTFKSAGPVYGPPTRSYSFDTDFLDIAKMPPGTPLFRDVENVGGHQDFSSQ